MRVPTRLLAVCFVSLLLAVGLLPAPPTRAWTTSTAGFGINAHLASRYVRLETMDEPGSVVRGLDVTWVREDVQWSRVEPRPGEFDWAWHDRAFAIHRNNGARIIGVLGPAVGWATAEQGIAPDAVSYWGPPPERYAQWAAEVARHYRGQVAAWELWNEPDHPYHWRPSPDPAAYSRLVQATVRAIRAVDPDVTILSGGAGPFESSFLDAMGRYGAWQVVDGISIHPYVDPATPEAGLIAANGIAALEPLHQRYGRKPIWVTEFGWSSGACERDPHGRTDEEAQANYLVRGALLLRAAGVGPILWYNLKDEHVPCYGMIRTGGGADDFGGLKPAAHALRALSKEVGSAEGRLGPALQPSTVVLPFEDGNGWNAPYPAGTGAVVLSQERVHGGSSAARVDYRWTSGGNEYLAWIRRDRTPLPQGTSQIGMWVWGDGSGHRMALHLEDSGGEVLHYPLGVVAQQGWQWLSASLTGPAEGGDGNRLIDGTAYLRAVVIDDHPDTSQGSGTIYWDDLTAFTGPEVYSVRFGDDNATLDVLWSLLPTTIQMPTRAREARLVDRWGQSRTIAAQNGSFVLPLGPSPVYLHHQAAPPAPPVAAPPAPTPVPAPPSSPAPTPREAAPAPYNGQVATAFVPVWARPDRPVAEGRTERGWLWGPQPRTASVSEPYAEGAGGQRLVQYWDKTRMELTKGGGPVTNGLLVVELITGQRQVGDARFVADAPADEAVAGDALEANPAAPTYRSLGKVAFPLNKTRTQAQPGQASILTLDRDGNVGADQALARYGVRYGAYEQELGHNIADVFATFFAQQGLIYDNGYKQGRVFDPMVVVGLPLAEPYWTRARVGGVERDVLVQPFQRRVLTYTPDNTPNQRVEMGNVGLHYLRWRYGG